MPCHRQLDANTAEEVRAAKPPPKRHRSVSRKGMVPFAHHEDRDLPPGKSKEVVEPPERPIRPLPADENEVLESEAPLERRPSWAGTPAANLRSRPPSARFAAAEGPDPALLGGAADWPAAAPAATQTTPRGAMRVPARGSPGRGSPGRSSGPPGRTEASVRLGRSLQAVTVNGDEAALLDVLHNHSPKDVRDLALTPTLDLAELLTLLLGKGARQAAAAGSPRSHASARARCAHTLSWLEEVMSRGVPGLAQRDYALLRRSCYALSAGRDDTARAAKRTVALLESQGGAAPRTGRRV